jgi:acetyl/propionyl-CoA carboxylase alpha subunit
MLGKVIAVAPTREAARHRLVAALDDCAVLGLTTNLGFARALAASDAFRDGQVDTGWLDRHPDGVRPPDPGLPALVAAWVVAGGSPTGPPGTPADPLAVADGWRVGGPPAPTRVELVVGGGPRVYAVTADRVTEPGGEQHTVRLVSVEEDLVRLEVDGVVETAVVRVTRTEVAVAHHGHTHVLERPRAADAGSAAVLTGGTVTAPMPGTVLSVAVAEGEQVHAGQLLGVVEAMKMELALAAPFAGTVTAVAATPGAGVALGAPLFTVEEES